MKRLFFFFLFAQALSVYAQQTPPIEEKIYELPMVETMPEYPGGMPALVEFLTTNVNYPKEAVDKNIEGVVYIEFVVDQQGKVGHVQVKRGVDPLLDNEAARVAGMLPDWKPALVKGKAVKCNYVMPIRFRIPKKETK